MLTQLTTFQQYFVLLLFTFFIASCGGSDGDDEGNGDGGDSSRFVVSDEFPEIPENTQWRVASFAFEDTCEEFSSTSFLLDINFDSTDNSVSATLGGEGFSDTPLTVRSTSATSVVISGSFARDGGTTTFSNFAMNFNQISSEDAFTGSADWSWEDSSDSSDSCSGRASLSGTLESSSGSIVDVEFEDDDSSSSVGTAASGELIFSVGDFSGTLTQESEYVDAGIYTVNSTSTIFVNGISINSPFGAIVFQVNDFTGSGTYSGSSVAFAISVINELCGFSLSDGVGSSNVSISITQTGSRISGTASGSVSCFEEESEAALPSRNVEVSFDLELESITDLG